MLSIGTRASGSTAPAGSRCSSGRLPAALLATVALAVGAAGVSWGQLAFGQAAGEDYFNVRDNSDYYQYRHHPTYANANQLLRVVEHNHQRLGTEKIRAGRYDNAYHEFAFVLNTFPNHPEALLGLDEVCRKVRNPGCNMGLRFERAIAVNPKAAGTYVIQGIYLSRTGKNPAAIESYKRAIELQPDSPTAHYNLGLAYVETKDFARANEHAQKAYTLGFPFPGLREKLRRAGQWKPSEAAGAPTPPAVAESPAAPADQGSPASSGDRNPGQ